jgi:hypothetical protein
MGLIVNLMATDDGLRASVTILRAGQDEGHRSPSVSVGRHQVMETWLDAPLLAEQLERIGQSPPYRDSRSVPVKTHPSTNFPTSLSQGGYPIGLFARARTQDALVWVVRLGTQTEHSVRLGTQTERPRSKTRHLGLIHTHTLPPDHGCLGEVDPDLTPLPR